MIKKISIFESNLINMAKGSSMFDLNGIKICNEKKRGYLEIVVSVYDIEKSYINHNQFRTLEKTEYEVSWSILLRAIAG